MLCLSGLELYSRWVPLIFIQIKGFLTAYRNTAAYCIFLPFETLDSGSKFRRNQVFITELPLE